MKHTKGRVEISKDGKEILSSSIHGWCPLDGKNVVAIIPEHWDKAGNANLIAEAFNTFEDTGLSPAQLAAKLKEVEEQRREMLNFLVTAKIHLGNIPLKDNKPEVYQFYKDLKQFLIARAEKK